MNTLASETVQYGIAAFNSRAIPTLPSHKWPNDSRRSGLFRTALHWGNYANREPWQDIGAQLQAGVDNDPTTNCNTDLYISNQGWRFDTTNKIQILIPFLKWSCIAFIPWIIWTLVMSGAISAPLDSIMKNQSTYLSMAIASTIPLLALVMMGFSSWFMWSDSPKYKKYLAQMFLGIGICATASVVDYGNPVYGENLLIGSVAMALTVFMGLIGWDYLFGLYLRVFQHDGSEFNRQTGMVKVARRFRPAFTAPFYEFDATMEMRPGPHGNSSMTVWLHHRYSDFEVFLGGKIQSLGMSREECLAFWDTLQRYMDVSQPLPELPILEQFRHLDPTTDAQDKLSKRPLRRWRDTKYKVWDRTERPAMMQKNLQYPWQSQACILIARIDPTLSVEAYYRAQEAKGIHSTPKADDYDNIHRG
ncbi:hypothetical protein ACIOYV_01145 [Pseudomonas sp. NPDC087342]|uniref:hypothetical protein n=1 Tax=Pseudomonas sp. NPDC087342 TaxID=3364437 RepID=UPI00381B20A5